MANLGKLIRGVMALDSSAPAIEFHKKWSSWGDLTAIIDSLEALLDAKKLGPGARVGGMLRNSPEVAAAIVGTILGDRCLVTFNPMLPDDKLAQDIRTLGTPVVLGVTEDWDRPSVRRAAEDAGVLGLILTGDPANPVEELFDNRGDREWPASPGVGIEMLTSGTTGTPKRIPLRKANFERMILDAAVFESRSADEPARLRKAVSILNTPFSHIGGIFGLFVCISAGRKACLLERFRVDEFVDAVYRHQPKAAGAPPSALRMILDAGVPKEKLESLVVFRTATAPLDPDLADAFYERYGIPVLQNYGATEFAGGVAGWSLRDFKQFGKSKRGSVGRLNPGVEGRVTNALSGEELATGEEGLLELKARHLGDGASWVRTTDLARMDEDGFIWILGRADNAINRGGFKIIPDDVVRAIEAHPAVREACVIAMPDPRLGQVPAAAYLVKNGFELEVDELQAFLRSRLTSYQIPVQLVRLDEFPRTPSMKVSQPELRKLLEAAA